MKKLFTILGILLMFGCPKSDAEMLTTDYTSKCIATPEMEMQMLQLNESIASDEINADGKRVVKRDYSDGMYTYRLTIALTNIKITDWFEIRNKQGEIVPFEKMPLYVAQYVLSSYDKSGKMINKADCYISWPTYASWDFDGAQGNYNIVPIEEFAKGTSRGFCNTFAFFDETLQNVGYKVNLDLGIVTAYSIWSNKTKYSASLCNGQVAKFAEPGLLQTQFSINDYDKSEGSIESSNEFYFLYGPTFSNSESMTLNYIGTCRAQGFSKSLYRYDIDNVHIFNAGVVDAESWGRDCPYYFTDWTAKQRFFVYGTTAMNHVEIAKGTVAFDDSKISVEWNDDVDNLDRSNENVKYFHGAMYAPADQGPEGVYRMKDIKIVDDQYVGQVMNVKPTDWSLIPGGYTGAFDSWSRIDGLECVWQNFMQYPRESVKVQVGTTDGFVLHGVDSYGNTMTGSYTGNIIYHYDPTDVSQTREIAAIGDIDKVETVFDNNTFRLNCVNGKIVVASDNDDDVEVYTLSGMKVASASCKAAEKVEINVNGGVYVVKVGQKSVKVVI